jgi:hypothetical protein
LLCASEIYLRRSILSANGKDLCSTAIEIYVAFTGECKGRRGISRWNTENVCYMSMVFFKIRVPHSFFGSEICGCHMFG